MMIWFRGCSAIVKRRWRDGIHSIYYSKSLLRSTYQGCKDTDDAMQQALAKYDNGELESYEDEFESAFAESEDD